MQIIYNGLNLNDGINYLVESETSGISPVAEKNIQKIARSNSSILLRKSYGIKNIEVDILVWDITKDALDSRLDTLKYTVEQTQKNLDIDYASGVRRFVSTGYITDIQRNPRNARVKISFEVYGAFGQDVSATSQNYNGKTTTPYDDTITIGGSAPATPDITIVLNTFTGSSTRTIKIKNVNTGDYVQLDRSDWSAGDVIAISCATMAVFKNSVKIPYLGIMPIWNVGLNNFEYSDTFSARNVNIGFSYNAKWL